MVTFLNLGSKLNVLNTAPHCNLLHFLALCTVLMFRANERIGVEEINISDTAWVKRIIRNVIKWDITIN